MSENNNESITKSVLRPSLLVSASKLKTDSNAKTDLAGASNKVNSFLKQFDEEEENQNIKTSQENDADSGAKSLEESDEKNEKSDPLAMLTKLNSLPKSNLFCGKSSIPATNNESLGFVFGQNVHERVVVAESAQNVLNSNNSLSSENNKETTSDSGLLFSNAMQSNSVVKSSETTNKSLTEVAREYEESRAQKRKYEEVETFTGEENEKNIIDINCKIFAFVNSNWEERGRGNLRLNDSKEEKNVSRVVFRTSGNLRLLLNTKVWCDMTVERPSPKSLRLTAMDNNGQVKIFLIMSRPDDISSVYNALTKRIQVLKNLDSSKDKVNTTENENKKKGNRENNENNADNTVSDEPSPKKLVTDKEYNAEKEN